jgi:hypothetical protein
VALFKSLLKQFKVQEIHSGDLYVVVGTGTFVTTGQTLAVAAGGIQNLKFGLASPFHASAHGANDVIGVDSDSLNTTNDTVTLNRPASGTSALVACYLLVGDRITTS